MVRCGRRLDAPANPDGRSHRQWRVPREDGEEQHHQDRDETSKAVTVVDVRAAARAGLVLLCDLCEIAAGKDILHVAHLVGKAGASASTGRAGGESRRRTSRVRRASLPSAADVSGLSAMSAVSRSLSGLLSACHLEPCKDGEAGVQRLTRKRVPWSACQSATLMKSVPSRRSHVQIFFSFLSTPTVRSLHRVFLFLFRVSLLDYSSPRMVGQVTQDMIAA